MKMQSVNIVIVGVGGQGTLLTSKILAQLALFANWGVKVSEVHGMAQRGGSVITHVRIGEQVNAPLVAQGEADYLLAFEPLEASRAVNYLKPKGSLIVNTQRISPMPVLSGAVEYPQEPFSNRLEAQQAVEALDAYTMAVDAGNYRAVNMVLMGVLSKHLPFLVEDWERAIAACVKPHTLAVNRKAFTAGRKSSEQ